MSASRRDFLGRPQGGAPPAARGGDSLEGAALEGFSRLIRRRWPLLVVCLLASVAASLVLSLREEKEYAATATILFQGSGFDEALFGPAFSSSSDPDRVAATNVELVSLGVVADRTAARLKLPGLTGGAISSQVNVDSKRDSDIATVTVTGPQRAQVPRVANTFSNEYIAFRRNTELARVRQAQRQVSSAFRALSPTEQVGPRGRRLTRRSQQLASFTTLRTGDAQVVQRAGGNVSQVAPTPRRAVGVGLMLGLLLGVGLTFLLEQLSRRLRDEEEVEQAFGLPVLARVPYRRRRQTKGEELRDHDPEVFRTLRANLRYFNVERPIRSVLITSPNQGDGKSTISWNLALVQAQVGRSVLLIEADLRAPKLGARLGLSSESGLSLVLAGIDPMEAGIIAVESDGAVVDVLAAGPIPPNPAELIESGRMTELLEAAHDRYDFVVVDSPPAIVVADAIPLVSRVDGVIVVARLKHTTRKMAQALRLRLVQLRAPVLGVVTNGGPTQRVRYDQAAVDFPEGVQPQRPISVESHT